MQSKYDDYVTEADSFASSLVVAETVTYGWRIGDVIRARTVQYVRKVKLRFVISELLTLFQSKAITTQHVVNLYQVIYLISGERRLTKDNNILVSFSTWS